MRNYHGSTSCARLRYSPPTFVSAVWEYAQAPFPLTPTLSLGEREAQSPVLEQFKRFGVAD
jgi:hypothetical protein